MLFHSTFIIVCMYERLMRIEWRIFCGPHESPHLILSQTWLFILDVVMHRLTLLIAALAAICGATKELTHAHRSCAAVRVPSAASESTLVHIHSFQDVDAQAKTLCRERGVPESRCSGVREVHTAAARDIHTLTAVDATACRLCRSCEPRYGRWPRCRSQRPS